MRYNYLDKDIRGRKGENNQKKPSNFKKEIILPIDGSSIKELENELLLVKNKSLSKQFIH